MKLKLEANWPKKLLVLTISMFILFGTFFINSTISHAKNDAATFEAVGNPELNLVLDKFDDIKFRKVPSYQSQYHWHINNKEHGRSEIEDVDYIIKTNTAGKITLAGVVKSTFEAGQEISVKYHSNTKQIMIKAEKTFILLAASRDVLVISFGQPPTVKDVIVNNIYWVIGGAILLTAGIVVAVKQFKKERK